MNPPKLLCFLCFITCFPLFLAQQPYIGQVYTNSESKDNSTSAFGYSCNGQDSACPAYLIFRSQPPYTSVASISRLLNADPSQVSQINSVSSSATFPTGQEVIVPVNCSCSGMYYQANSSYTVIDQDTYFTIANNTYQGLSTCHALQEQNIIQPINLNLGMVIDVPLRCACPTRNQTSNGVKYLLTYLVSMGDSVWSISQRFGVEMQSSLDANELSLQDSTINFFTTLLIPLRDQPSVSQTLAPPPPPPPPPPPSTPSGNKFNKTWVYVVIGVAIGAVALIFSSIGFCIFWRNKKRKSGTTVVSKNPKDVEKYETVETPKELLGVSDIGHTLKMYKYEELKLATNNFSSECNVGGSVYRGVFKGDRAAIKKMIGDVTEEVELLKKINHFNLIRLSGICFGEGHWYLVYEFAESGPLKDWIHNVDSSNALTWLQRLQIVLDVAMGLNYLHSYTKPGYVHKDLNSSNVLLDDNFRAKVANFGKIRSTGGQDADEFHLTRHIVGTTGYMAPEYLENGLISPKLDVYAFGIVMLEVITGKEAVIPWGDGNMLLSDALRGVLNKETAKEDLAEFIDPNFQGDYPSDLALIMAKLIERCLWSDAMSRPGMDEIVQALSGLLAASLSLEFQSDDSQSKSFSADAYP